MVRGRCARVGLVATNSIRGGANRRVLDQIATAGLVLYDAWDDEPWVVDGAAVRVALVCFGLSDSADGRHVRLDGIRVSAINSDLTGRAETGLDVTGARRLPENAGIAFMGDTKGGPFDVPGEVARRWLALPANPNGRANSEVVRPWVNGLDVTRRPRDMWIIDFGVDIRRGGRLYEVPYE